MACPRIQLYSPHKRTLPFAPYARLRHPLHHHIRHHNVRIMTQTDMHSLMHPIHLRRIPSSPLAPFGVRWWTECNGEDGLGGGLGEGYLFPGEDVGWVSGFVEGFLGCPSSGMRQLSSGEKQIFKGKWCSPRSEKPRLLRDDVPLPLAPDRAKPIPFPLAQDPPRNALCATTGNHLA